MKFTVREVHHDHVVVDFEDGSWAQVPLDESMNGNKAQIVSAILEYAPKPVITWVNNIPLTVGEEVYLPELEDKTVKRDETQGPMDYKAMREELYPSIKDQLDAYYWASQGVEEPLESIKESIAYVKEIIPKDMPPMTPGGLSEYLLTL